MLRQGTSGDEVKALQRLLRIAGQDTGTLDGVFGPKTDAAVRAFQEAEGLAADGIAGPKTMAALEAAAEAKKESGSGLKGYAKDEDAGGYRPGGAE